MASNRKTGKGISSGRPRSYSELYRNSKDAAGTSGVASTASAVPGVGAATRQDNIDWHNEYGHVIDDLRRLGIITAVLVIAMLAASFIV